VLCGLAQSFASQRPLVWVVEDLQFAPSDSLDMIQSLARVADGERMLLLLTSRSSASDDRLHLDTGAARLHRIRLPRLSARDVGELVNQYFGSDVLADRLAPQVAYKSDGVPFVALEILHALKESGRVERHTDGTWIEVARIEDLPLPSTVREMVALRLGKISDEDRQILDAASVSGFEFDVAMVARVLERTKVDILQRLAILERRWRLVRSAVEKLCFDHHTVHEVVYGDLMEVLREEYHRVYATHMARDIGDGTLDGLTAYRLVHHSLVGGASEISHRCLDAALVHLGETHQHARTIELVDKVLRAPDTLGGEDRARLLLRVCQPGGAFDLLGAHQRQHELCVEAERLALETDDAALASRAAASLALALSHLERHDAALESAQRAVDSGRRSGDVAVECRAVGIQGTVLGIAGRISEARSEHEQQLELALRSGASELVATAINAVGSIHLMEGELDDARRCFDRAIELYSEQSNRRGEVQALGHVGIVLCLQHRLDEALELLSTQLEIVRELGDRRAEAVTACNIGVTLWNQGRHRRAREYERQAIALCRQIGDRGREALAEGIIGNSYWSEGRLQEARTHANRQIALFRAMGDRRGEAFAQCSLAAVQLSEGRLEEGRARLAAALVTGRETGDRQCESVALYNLAYVASELDDTAKASQLVDECLALCEAHGNHLVQGLALLLRGECVAPEQAVAAYETALSHARDFRLTACEVMALCELARRDDSHVDAADKALARHTRMLNAEQLRRARWLLWKATGDRTHLDAAKRSLDDARDRVDPEHRKQMVARRPTHAAIVRDSAELHARA
jgi:tetratricopeptide (TPR) repeat protein